MCRIAIPLVLTDKTAENRPTLETESSEKNKESEPRVRRPPRETSQKDKKDEKEEDTSSNNDNDDYTLSSDETENSDTSSEGSLNYNSPKNSGSQNDGSQNSGSQNDGSQNDKTLEEKATKPSKIRNSIEKVSTVFDNKYHGIYRFVPEKENREYAKTIRLQNLLRSSTFDKSLGKYRRKSNRVVFNPLHRISFLYSDDRGIETYITLVDLFIEAWKQNLQRIDRESDEHRTLSALLESVDNYTKNKKLSVDVINHKNHKILWQHKNKCYLIKVLDNDFASLSQEMIDWFDSEHIYDVHSHPSQTSDEESVRNPSSSSSSSQGISPPPNVPLRDNPSSSSSSSSLQSLVPRSIDLNPIHQKKKIDNNTFQSMLHSFSLKKQPKATRKRDSKSQRNQRKDSPKEEEEEEEDTEDERTDFHIYDDDDEEEEEEELDSFPRQSSGKNDKHLLNRKSKSNKRSTSSVETKKPTQKKNRFERENKTTEESPSFSVRANRSKTSASKQIDAQEYLKREKAQQRQIELLTKRICSLEDRLKDQREYEISNRKPKEHPPPRARKNARKLENNKNDSPPKKKKTTNSTRTRREKSPESESEEEEEDLEDDISSSTRNTSYLLELENEEFERGKYMFHSRLSSGNPSFGKSSSSSRAKNISKSDAPRSKETIKDNKRKKKTLVSDEDEEDEEKETPSKKKSTLYRSKSVQFAALERNDEKSGVKPKKNQNQEIERRTTNNNNASKSFNSRVESKDCDAFESSRGVLTPRLDKTNVALASLKKIEKGNKRVTFFSNDRFSDRLEKNKGKSLYSNENDEVEDENDSEVLGQPIRTAKNHRRVFDRNNTHSQSTRNTEEEEELSLRLGSPPRNKKNIQ